VTIKECREVGDAVDAVEFDFMEGKHGLKPLLNGLLCVESKNLIADVEVAAQLGQNYFVLFRLLKEEMRLLL